MSTDTNQTATPAPKYKSIDDVPQRLFFNDRESRDLFVQELAASNVVGNIPILVPADYDTLDAYWLFAKNGRRVPVNPADKSEGTRVEPTSLLFSPVPTFDEVLADEKGREMLQSLYATKVDHALAARVKKLLESATISPADVSSLPRNVIDFAVATRSSDGGELAAYNALAAKMLKYLADTKPWSRFRFTKPVLRQALQSRAYARVQFPEIEEKNGFATLFISFRNGVEAYNANRKPDQAAISAALFDQWEANRDTFTITGVDDDGEAEDDFGIDGDPFAAPAAVPPATPPAA